MTKGIPVEGDILITTEAPLGYVALAPDFKFALGQRVIGLKLNLNLILPSYLLACMKSQEFQDQLLTSSTGSTVTGVRQSILLECVIPLPNNDQQKKIGDFDQEINKEIKLLKTQRERVEQLINGISFDLLSGRKRVNV